MVAMKYVCVKFLVLPFFVLWGQHGMCIVSDLSLCRLPFVR